MKLGMMSYGYDKKEIKQIKDYGLDFVEYCVNALEENPTEHIDFLNRIDEIKSACKEYDIFVGSVGRWGGIKINEDGTPNEKEIEIDKMLIEAAGKLGCPIYLCNCNYAEKLSLYDNYTVTIKYFEELIKFGKQYGVTIATNNCRWNSYVHSDPAWSVVHGHLKELGIKFDPSHSIVANKENYLSEMKKWGHRFVHIHIKGTVMIDGERFDNPPAGLDMTDWKSFFAILYKVGYNGNLSIEPHSETWQGELADKGIRYTIKTIKSLIV